MSAGVPDWPFYVGLASLRASQTQTGKGCLGLDLCNRVDLKPIRSHLHSGDGHIF